MLRYKKLFLFSVLLSAASVLAMKSTAFGFGLPFEWITVHGMGEGEYLAGMTMSNATRGISFDLWNLTAGSLLIYVLLRLSHKGLTVLHKETGEK